MNEVLKPEYGVDATQFRDEQALKSPPYQVIKRAQLLWRQAKRPADIVLAIDTSGSMNQEVTYLNPDTGKEQKETKIKLAEDAAKEFVDQLSDGDDLTVILFDDQALFLDRENPTITMTAKGKVEIKQQLTNLIAGGETALYDAVGMAQELLSGRGRGVEESSCSATGATRKARPRARSSRKNRNC